MARSLVPDGVDEAVVEADAGEVKLTNLGKPFWPALGLSKRDLLRYYEAVAPWLVPHLADRPMVMKRYPHGWQGKFFFMKRAPSPRPAFVETVRVLHRSGNEIDFPIVQDLASLLWLVNLGCIDLNPWYSRRDDLDRPDYLHFDLDPVEGATFETVREVALEVRALLEQLGMPVYPKTSGSKGMHLYVPIVRGPLQKHVWIFAKAFALEVARRHPRIATAAYTIALRPKGRVLVDYNQNRWGSTLASVYSVRPTPGATVSTPLGWREVERGAKTEDFDLRNVPARLAARGELFCPPTGGDRFDLAPLIPAAAQQLHASGADR